MAKHPQIPRGRKPRFPAPRRRFRRDAKFLAHFAHIRRLARKALEELSPPLTNLIAWLQGGTTDGLILLESVGTIDSTRLVNRPCLTMDGLDYITVPGLTVNDKVTLLGWEFGPELVTNGGFDAATDWTLTTGWSITNGKLTASGVVAGVNQSIGYATGSTLFVSNDITVTNGSLIMALSGGVAGSSMAADGTYYTILTSVNSDGRLFLAPSGGYSGSVDNVSAKQVTLNGSTAIPTVSAGQINFTAGTVAGILINDELRYTCEEGSGDKLYPVDGSGVVATIVSPTAGIATVRSGTCDEASWNAQYGYTLSGSVYIPALADGSADATGGAIQYEGGFVHNGGDYSLLFPAGVGMGTTEAERTFTYNDLLALAVAAVGTDEWRFSYNDDGMIVDGVYYSPALTGAELTKLNVFLESRRA